jgi:hypothetical protein
MQLKSIGPVIARRELLLDGKAPVEILIGRPYRAPDVTSHYVCPYQIRGMGDERVRGVVGMDAIQAIQHAIHILGVRLKVADEADRLPWEGGSFKGHLGLPSWLPDTDLLRLGSPKSD